MRNSDAFRFDSVLFLAKRKKKKEEEEEEEEEEDVAKGIYEEV